MEQLPLDLIEPQAPSLDNFVVGENAELIAALWKTLQGKGPQFVFLWGPEGSGKSHLLRALTPTQRGVVPQYDVAQKLYTVDNVHSLTDDELESFFGLMNYVRSDPASRLVSAAAMPVSEMTGMRDDIKSRLAWGLTFAVQPLSSEDCQTEFMRLAADRGIEMTEDVADWVRVYCPRDIRSLKHFLDRLDRYALERKRRVTRRLLFELVQQNLEMG